MDRTIPSWIPAGHGGGPGRLVWLGRVAIGIALTALVAYSFWQRWQVLAASPFPLGVDGYFYPIQVRALLEHGTLQYPASPLTFWFMLPLAAVTDPIMGAKLGAALGGALIALPAYVVGTRLGRGRGAGLLAASIAACSAGSAYLSIEFVKQGIGLTVALAAVWLVLRALESPTNRRIGIAIAGVVATALTHKMAAAIVLAIALPAAAEEARVRGVLRGRRLLYLLLAVTVLGATALVLGLAMPERFLSPDDLALLNHSFSSTAQWSAPALATPNYTLVFDHEAMLGLGAACGAGLVLGLTRQRPHSVMIAGWAIVALGITIGLPWLVVDDPQGLGFRLRIAAFVPLALSSAIVADWLASRLGSYLRALALAGVALIVALRAPAERTEGRVVAHPALVTAVMAATQHIPSGAIVIVPERHILFMAAWYTRAKVALRPESVPDGERMRLMPLAFIGEGSPLERAIDDARREPSIEPPIGLHPRHRNGLVLTTEPTWDWLLARMPEDVRAHWARWPTI